MKQKVQEDARNALRAGDEVKTGALRMLLAAFINKEKENPPRQLAGGGQEPLSDEVMIQIVNSEVKKRREAIEAFEKGGRMEMAEKEKKEMEILQAYLPEQLKEDEIRELAKEAIEQVGAQSPQDIGKVMAALMPKVKGKSDGALVSKIVKELL